MRTLAIVLLFVGLFLLANGCGDDATEPPLVTDCSSVADTTQPMTVSYRDEILPLFELQNYGCSQSACHGSQPGSSNFSVSTYEGLFKAGDQAAAMNICSIKPGDPDRSYFFLKLQGQTGTIQAERMPLNGPALSPADLDLVRTWILEGARNDSNQPPDCSSVADTTQPATVSYQNDITPMFEEPKYGCGALDCHGDLASSNYSVNTYEDLFSQGDEAFAMNVCSIKPGDPDASYLFLKMQGQAGTIQGERMPLGGAMVTPDDLDLMRVWILEGARNN